MISTFSPTGLCVSESAHVTNGGSGGVMSTAGLEMPTHGLPRPSFGMKLLGGETNVTFVKYYDAN